MSDLGLGKWGEDLAAEHLEKKDYRVVERNFKTRFGEIDLVVKKGGLLVFVEVKTRQGSSPEWGITKAKIGRVKKMAEVYLVKKQPDYKDLRIDAVCVEVKDKPVVRHYEAVGMERDLG